LPSDMAEYSKEVSDLLALASEWPLGVREIDLNVRRRLESGVEFPDAYSPQGALTGLWLRLGGWDQAHEIAQNLPTLEGSLWHGIIHRIEGDPGNARYWFARVPSHPLFSVMRDEARRLAQESGAEYFTSGEWRPETLVEFDRQARPGSPEAHLAEAIALMEWRTLFNYCARPSATDRSLLV
jgi:hypothetical protein